MRRDVSAHLDLTVTGPATLVLSVGVAVPEAQVEEHLTVLVDGTAVPVSPLRDHHGSRLHQVECGRSKVSVDYSATITGQADAAGVEPIDLVSFLRPSRYCESDVLFPTADSQFGNLSGHELLAAVAQSVHNQLAYVFGSSLPTDGAVRTMLGRQGVCRDFAHLTIALLRARDVPARLVSVYAPGLSPMDFHAVCEAYVDGSWQLVDATWLAPRQTLVRIATGRDAADTAFLTSHGAEVILESMQVMAVVDTLPNDDWSSLVQLR